MSFRRFWSKLTDNMVIWLFFVPFVITFLVLAGLLEDRRFRRKGRTHA